MERKNTGVETALAYYVMHFLCICMLFFTGKRAEAYIFNRLFNPPSCSKSKPNNNFIAIEDVDNVDQW